MIRLSILLAGFLSLLPASPLRAQIDPVQRRVIQAGYAHPIHESGPIAAYAFYYHNQPGFFHTNLTLRLAVVPVYLDAELGVREALGRRTDLAFGVSGGGFADSYNEFNKGNFVTAESFTGHAAELNSSIYHLFNPTDIAPIHGLVRGAFHGSFFERDTNTDPDFELPNDLASFTLRTGLRLGGREPYTTPRVAGEFSLWHESSLRLNPSSYGFNNDRSIRQFTHRFWGRALFAYTVPSSKQHFEISLTAGTSVDADRFSAYRLGSFLPLIDEFPLSLPGYHIEEISADQFALLNAQFLQPLDPAKAWHLMAFGSVAAVDYLPGLNQSGHWHSGVGGGLFYRSRSGDLEVGAAYSYGISAIRQHGHGAHSLTFILQYNLDAILRDGGRPFWEPVLGTKTWQGLFRRVGRP